MNGRHTTVIQPGADPAGPVGPDGTGRALLVVCFGVAAGVAAGNLFVPDWRWLAAVVPLALLAAWRGLDGHAPAWWAAGLLLGLAACAAAPRAPVHASSLPVRFAATVRDGWRATETGFRTRVMLRDVEYRGRTMRHSREVTMVVGGSASPGLPRPGQRIEGSGELVFDSSWPLRRPLLRVKTAQLLGVAAGGSVVDALRERAVEALHAAAGVHPGRIRASGLAAALVLGRRELLPAGEVASLRRSGLAHLLAVSGLHVGMVSAIAWLVLQLAGVRPRSRRWAVMVVLIAFALLSGGAAPVRRASLGGILYLGMRQLGRPLLAFPAVAGVITTLLLLEPRAMFEISFQLSALVTLALVRWVPELARLLRWPLGRGAPVVAVVLVAQAASLPLVAAHFVSVPVWGAATNLVAVPVGFAAVACSLGACVAAPLEPAAAVMLAALDGVRHVLDAVAAWGGHVTAVCPPPPAPLAAGLVLLGVVAMSSRRWVWPAGVVMVVALAGWIVWPLPASRPPYELRTLPIADGMAVLIGGPQASILVDGGRAPNEALAALAALRVRRLAAVVVTHPDVDHTGGIAAVLRERRVGSLVFPAAEGSRREFVELRRLARERGAREIGVVAGQRLRFGELTLDVLWPGLTATGPDNDRSLVAAVTAGGVRVLLTGDLEAGGERALLASPHPPGRADILQLPHHGSATSSSPAFLVAVGPAVAMAATGRQPRYRYPAVQTIGRLRRAWAVLASQSEGVEAVSWSAAGRLTVATRSPVTVHVRGAAAH